MSNDEPRDGAERRAEDRHLACYPFQMQRGERGATGGMEIAVIHDVSASGALLYTVGEIAAGTRVKLHLDFGEEPVHVVEGHVVRLERCPSDVADVWRFAVGVQFAESRADLLPQMRELERKLGDGT